MRRLAPLIIALTATLAASSAAGASAKPHYVCRAVYLNASLTHTASLTETCRGNVTPHIFVNGHGALRIGEISDRGNTATMYGDGAAVRIHQKHDRLVTVSAATVLNGPIKIRVTFTR
jgi:hypothetical protein